MTTSAPAVVDLVFAALAHPVRRGVVARLGLGPASVSELAGPSGVALPTFVQHLRVLERAGVVRSEKRGRVRTCALVPEPLVASERWLADQRSTWTARLDRLDAFLLEPEPEP